MNVPEALIDVRTDPFSRRGSYLSVSRLRGETLTTDQLWLHWHAGRGVDQRDLLRIEFTAGGRGDSADASARVPLASPVSARVPLASPVSARVPLALPVSARVPLALPVQSDFIASATPARLLLKDGAGGEVAIAIDENDTLRIHGVGGAGVRLAVLPGPYVVAHPARDGAWVINHRPSRTHSYVEPLHGTLCVEAPWHADHCPRIIVDVLPDADGRCDIAIDQFQSTWLPRSRPAFEEVVAAAQRDFDQWLRGMPAVPVEFEHARARAAYVLWSSVVRPRGLLSRPALYMSKLWMDQVWSWDHCFNALALVDGHADLAWDQLMVFADHQDEFGCLPDAVNPSFRHYNFTKPPVHGWALRAWMCRNPAAFDDCRLREIYQMLARWTDWWLTYRVMPGQRLPYYLHGNDSGWDNSTLFIEGTPLVSPDLAALLAIQCDVLADLASRLGDAAAAVRWRQCGEGLLAALVDELWNGERFIAVKLPERRPIQGLSLVAHLPILLGRRLPQPVVEQTVEHLRGYVTRAGVATERPDSALYEPNGYWRGPVWGPSTLLVVEGLRAVGEGALADEIALRFCRTCAASGFAENFDALTGTGLRDRCYTWTAAAFLWLAGLARPQDNYCVSD